MLQPGMKIVVYTDKKVELGEGTYVRTSTHPDMRMTVYECQEHTILAKGKHYLRVAGELQLIDPEF